MSHCFFPRGFGFIAWQLWTLQWFWFDLNFSLLFFIPWKLVFKKYNVHSSPGQNYIGSQGPMLFQDQPWLTHCPMEVCSKICLIKDLKKKKKTLTTVISQKEKHHWQFCMDPWFYWDCRHSHACGHTNGDRGMRHWSLLEKLLRGRECYSLHSFHKLYGLRIQSLIVLTKSYPKDVH